VRSGGGGIGSLISPFSRGDRGWKLEAIVYPFPRLRGRKMAVVWIAGEGMRKHETR
jgi:hypothetical protein